VARILHVEDDPIWLDLMRSRLSDHHVDSAHSLEEAVDYLQSNARYDLALVDLNLDTDSDLRGGEVLYHLMNVYPDTRRIVVTGSPPPGSVRENVFDKYDVEEIIIKGEFDAPGLRRVVEEALARPPGGLSRSLRLKRSELRQRYRDWRRRMASELREEIRVTEEHLYDASRVSEQAKRRAEHAVEGARGRRSAFEDDCDVIRIMLDTIKTPENLINAADALDAAEERYAAVFDENGLEEG
jgi:CheY-like chemotaxis protein